MLTIRKALGALVAATQIDVGMFILYATDQSLITLALLAASMAITFFLIYSMVMLFLLHREMVKMKRELGR